jgi:hypothetical protein
MTPHDFAPSCFHDAFRGAVWCWGGESKSPQLFEVKGLFGYGGRTGPSAKRKQGAVLRC